MTFEDKAGIVISQLREDRDRLQNIIEQIRAEIESKEMIETTSERESYNMALNDVLQIIDKYKAENGDKGVDYAESGNVLR